LRVPITPRHEPRPDFTHATVGQLLDEHA
jgi:hypothetical protein